MNSHIYVEAGLKNNVKELLDKGFKVGVIATILGLSIPEVNKIVQELNKSQVLQFSDSVDRPEFQVSQSPKEVEFTVDATVYHATRGQTQGNPRITADGTRINPRTGLSETGERVIALSRDLLKRWGGPFDFGDKVLVTGTGTLDGIWVVHDVMNSRFRRRVDFLVPLGEMGKWTGIKIKKVTGMKLNSILKESLKRFSKENWISFPVRGGDYIIAEIKDKNGRWVRYKYYITPGIYEEFERLKEKQKNKGWLLQYIKNHAYSWEKLGRVGLAIWKKAVVDSDDFFEVVYQCDNQTEDWGKMNFEALKETLQNIGLSRFIPQGPGYLESFLEEVKEQRQGVMELTNGDKLFITYKGSEGSGESGYPWDQLPKLSIKQGQRESIEDKRELYTALLRDDVDMVKELLDKGIDPNVQDEGGRTPLFYAAALRRTDTTKLLLDRGADPNIPDNNGTTPLHRVAFYGYVDKAKLLLNKGANPNIRDNRGQTPLHIAARTGDTSMIKLLLDHEADPNVKDEDGRTPLHKATYYGFIDVIKLLLEYGANPGIRDNKGWMPRDMTRRTDIIELLDRYTYPWDQLPKLSIKQGQRESIEDRIMLFRAIENNDIDKVKELLDKGVSVDVCDKDEWAPLHYAAYLDCEGIVKLLLDRGADPNAQDREGRTPLHYAAYGGWKQVVRLLLEYGADPDVKDMCGLTPKDLAQAYGWKSVVKLFDEYGYPWDQMPKLSVRLKGGYRYG